MNSSNLDIGTKNSNVKRHESFLLHIRPKSYESRSIAITHTWYLGYFCFFFLLLECITGVLLMVYYAPTPDEAYGSIIRLMTEVPFGWLLRDLHRLGGECMVAVVVLHMLRVFVSDAYRGKRAITWVSGVGLLVCTLILAFSGYLLPWDQLAFWAVTIGTSMVDTIPGIGYDLAGMLRGGQVFGADGLLRFYLLHIIGVPFILILLAAIHYYRVARVHGISLPPGESSNEVVKSRKTLFYPQVFFSEFVLAIISLVLLILVCTFFYDAPLELHADPIHTPMDTSAPWFFLWLQGVLKLGDTFIFGICFPLFLFFILVLLPLFVKGERKALIKRSKSMAMVFLLPLFLLGSSYVGSPDYGVDLHPVANLLQHYTPEEKDSVFHDVGYQYLPVGIFQTSKKQPVLGHEQFTTFLKEFTEDIDNLKRNVGSSRVEGIVLVEDWQVDVKRVNLRIHWFDEESSKPKSLESTIYVHNLNSDLDWRKNER